MLVPESDVEIIPLFPSISMLVDTNPEFQEVRSGLIEYSYEERMRDEDGIYRSNVGGWHSNTQILKDPKFATYKQFLEKYVTKCFEKFAVDRSVIDISSCWVNINGQGSTNSLHNHPGCDVSGCLWVKSDPTTGAFRMSNPHDFYQHGMLSMANDDIKNRYKYSENYFFTPKEGHLILFPAHLWHLVRKNNSEQDRISIAFNISTYKNKNEDVEQIYEDN